MRAALRPRPARGTPAATRDRLVAAAARVFNRDGFHGTDSNRLARAAGYAPGTFYKHFPDKRAIFVAAYERWVAAEWGALDADLRDARGRDVARRIVARVLRHHRAWRGLRASLHALVAVDPTVRRAYYRLRARQLDLFAGLRARLALAPLSRERAALLLYLIERTADAVAHGEPRRLGLSAPALVDALAEEVRRALR